MKKENLIIQARISSTVAGIGFLVVLINISSEIYFGEKSFLKIIIHEPSIWAVFLFALILFLTRKLKNPVVQYLQIIIFLINAALALLDGYESFHGIGFLILTILLAYRYGMLKRYIRLKLLILSLFTLFFLELSIHLEGVDRIGSSLNILVYLIFFLSIIYMIYTSEIKEILKYERIYHTTLSSIEAEKQKLMKEIKNHVSEIQKKELQIEEMERAIAAAEKTVSPLDLKEFNITEREVDVIREFCLNPQLTTKELASNLNMSLGTIKSHFISIFKKLSIRSRAELLDKCKGNFK